MFGRFSITLACSIFATTLIAKGETDTARSFPRTIAPTEDAAADAWNNAGGEKCKSVDCRALLTIGSTMDVFWAAITTPMKIGGGGKAVEAEVAAMVRPSVINKRLRQQLLSDPTLFPAICSRITSFTSLYNGDVPPQGDHFFMISLLQMAFLIDKAHPQHCLSSSLAAFPRSAESDFIIASAENFCLHYQWHTPACHRISR